MPTLDSTVLVDIAKQLNILAVVAYLVPIAVCIRRWPHLAPPTRPLILTALGISLLLNVLSEVGRQVWNTNILFIYFITWTETLFLGWAYYQALHTPRSRQLLGGAAAVFGLVALAEPLMHGFSGEQTYTRTAQSILLIGAALAYFEQVLHELRNIRLERDPMFLVSVGVTLYYSGTLMVFVLEDSMQKQHQISQIWIMYIIQAVLSIMLSGLIAWALHHAARRTQEHFNRSF
ncbi:hypothetical protein E5K00_09865 [Hymenobacter aquaticus]|uniref:Uncharacterized protein n=1 Tax=Hymenobacter aquaticus TaxID=1867101 RepID=A0A4Z0Q8H4_9BACT|nr:hypothetical protein [Hymenobacter aquaticus]TGE25473.1 hypothetical protein E5K00_09865 [Hymenobacter aquaticus]